MRYKLINMMAVCLLAGSLYLEADALRLRGAEETAENMTVQQTAEESPADEMMQARNLPQASFPQMTETETGDLGLMYGGIEEKLRAAESTAKVSVSMNPTAAGGVMPLNLVTENGAGEETDETAGTDEVRKDEAGGTDTAGDAAEDTNQQDSEYEDLALANVEHYVNVRKAATTESSIVGKIYGGAVAQILETVEGEDGQWFRIISGNVEGYIKSQFFLYGPAAADAIDEYVTRYATVIVTRLNVREKPDIESKRIGFVDKGEKVKLLETEGDWLKVQYTGTKTGYVAAEYVTVSEEFDYAKTLEEEAAEIAARKALEERQKVSETQATENTAMEVTPPSGNYGDNAELRSEIVEYAMQFLGNRYVHGGQSLTTGTDCSGFTSLIYAQFGYSISRTPSGQLKNAGRGVSYSEIQPGDIICYGSKKCSHVGLYIGDGQIIHAANSRKGVITSQADFDTILGVRNVID